MKKYGYAVAGCLLFVVLVAGAESITKELIGPSYGTATVSGDSATLATTLTVDTITATVVNATYSNATLTGNMVVAGATTSATLRVTGTTVLTGAQTLTGNTTMAGTLTMTSAATAAPTNAISAGRLITVNGTNYWIALYPANN